MSQRVAVLGGGISGLAAAWNLARRRPNFEILLLERSERLGGWMHSCRTEEGAVFELGPRSLRTAGVTGKTTLALMSDVGLSEEILPSHESAKRRMIYTSKHGLVDIPSGLSWLFRTKPPFSQPLLWAVLREISQKHSGMEDESVYDFFVRRLNQELADYVIDPLCRGVFAGDAKTLNIRSCFPLFYNYEKQHGSLVKGALCAKEDPLPEDVPCLVKRAVREKWTIYSLKRGLQSLPEAMTEVLREKGVRMLTQQQCTGLRFTAAGVQVEVAGGQEHQVNHVVSSLPADALASLLPSNHSHLSDLLGTIPSVSVGVVCLEFPGNDVLPAQYQESFGYLVPSNQPSQILGVVFDSSTFPELNRTDIPSTRLTVMLGGHWFPELFGDPDTADTSTITETALESLREHLGIEQSPSLTITKVHKNCIPQYILGHSTKLESIENHISKHRLPLTLVGSSYRGASVNDCVHNAVQATDQMLSQC